MKNYSASLNAFFETTLHGETIPADAVELSDEQYENLLIAQGQGKTIKPDDQGMPVTVSRAQPTTAQASASIRRRRDAALLASDWLVVRHREQTDSGLDLTLSIEQYADVLAYRQALRDLPTQSGFPNISLPNKPSFA